MELNSEYFISMTFATSIMSSVIASSENAGTTYINGIILVCFITVLSLLTQAIISKSDYKRFYYVICALLISTQIYYLSKYDKMEGNDTINIYNKQDKRIINILSLVVLVLGSLFIGYRIRNDIYEF